MMSILNDFHKRVNPKGFALREFRRALKTLSAGKIAIDCGANVGLFTLEMAATGATVHAFEPNAHAFAELQKRSAAFPNVVCHRKAVSDRPGSLKLFLHENADRDPVKWSTGSSTLPFKGNVSKENFETVEAVDLVAFIEELGGRVALLKIDVEGAEIGILNRLIDSGVHGAVGQVFVEVHDHKISDLIAPTNALRNRIRDEGITNINLDWQ
jgi:FkbM family methyltransferase